MYRNALVIAVVVAVSCAPTFAFAESRGNHVVTVRDGHVRHENSKVISNKKHVEKEEEAHRTDKDREHESDNDDDTPVVPSPFLPYTTTPSIGIAPLDVSFLYTKDICNGHLHTIDYGDGTTYDLGGCSLLDTPNPVFTPMVHVYTNPGTYTVSFLEFDPLSGNWAVLYSSQVIAN